MQCTSVPPRCVPFTPRLPLHTLTPGSRRRSESSPRPSSTFRPSIPPTSGSRTPGNAMERSRNTTLCDRKTRQDRRCGVHPIDFHAACSILTVSCAASWLITNHPAYHPAVLRRDHLLPRRRGAVSCLAPKTDKNMHAECALDKCACTSSLDDLALSRLSPAVPILLLALVSGPSGVSRATSPHSLTRPAKLTSA